MDVNRDPMGKISLSPIVSYSSPPQLERTSEPEESITGTSNSKSDASTPPIEEIIAEDGILCLIISRLTLREAVRTSVLSSRWRHIWTHLTEFNFDAINMLNAPLQNCDLETEEAYKLTKGKTDNFIRSVNSVLQQLQGAKIETFAVRHFLDKRHSQHIDAWLLSALASKTRVVRLHLFRPYTKTPVKPYEIQCELLPPLPSLDTLTLIFCSFKLPFRFDCFRHIKTLFLSEVDVTEEDFNYILSSCSSITKLTVLQVPKFVAINFPHPLSQLKNLVVYYCHQLRKIELNSAVNLSKLIYFGVPVDFRFRQSLKMNDADICFKARANIGIHNLDFYLNKLSCSLPLLQSLTLNFTNLTTVDCIPKSSSKFIHLTRLDWEWDARFEMSLLHLITVLNFAPLIQTLKLRLLKRVSDQPPQTPTKFREMLGKHPHTHLTTIQVSGFYFDTWQIEAAAYLLNNATELESMTIEIGSTDSSFIFEEIDEGGTEIVSDEILERGSKIISQYVPANVRLLIL